MKWLTNLQIIMRKHLSLEVAKDYSIVDQQLFELGYSQAEVALDKAIGAITKLNLPYPESFHLVKAAYKKATRYKKLTS